MGLSIQWHELDVHAAGVAMKGLAQRILTTAALVLIGLGPAGGDALHGSGGESVARKDLEARKKAIWAGLETATRTDGAPLRELPWQPIYSPLFPDRWPPTESTSWIEYGYASRIELGLSDAVRISQPWLVVAHRHNHPEVTFARRGGTKPEAASIQGFGPSPGVPMEADTRAALDKAARVSEYCLSLTSLPGPASDRTRELRAYYAAWMSRNGAFLALVKNDHAAFLDWLGKVD